MVVGVDQRRRTTKQVMTALVLGTKLGFDLRFAKLAEPKPAQELAQRPEAAIGSKQARHALSRQHRTVERQTWVPAEFHRFARPPPGLYGASSVRRIDQQHGPRHGTSCGQIKNPLRSSRSNPVV